MKNFLKRLVSAFHIPAQEDIERKYLDAAVSRYDLEMRQREVDRGLYRRPTLTYL